MASCEKCWAEAAGDVDKYEYLVGNRTCTPEEQAGHDATRCATCGRMTVHQHTGQCMVCDKEHIEAPTDRGNNDT